MEIEIKKEKKILGTCPFFGKQCNGNVCEWWLKANECCSILEIAESLNWIARQTKKL